MRVFQAFQSSIDTLPFSGKLIHTYPEIYPDDHSASFFEGPFFTYEIGRRKCQGLVKIAKLTARPRSGGVFARRTVLDQNLSLAQCLRRSGPRPSSLADKEALERAILLADFLESCLATFESNRVEDARFRLRMEQARAAALTIDYEVDVFRRRRSSAQKRLADWEARNSWEIRFTGMLGSGFNADRKEMEQAIADANRKVQAKKAEGATQRAIANESEAKAEEHKQRHLDAERRAKTTAEQGESAFPGFVGFLRAGLKQSHRQMLAGRGESSQAATANREETDASSGALVLTPFAQLRPRTTR